MNKYLLFSEKFRFFKNHPGMFVVGWNLNSPCAGYESMAAFVSGLDFFQGEGVMNEFRDWMLLRYGDKYRVFYWPDLIGKVYESLGGDISKNNDLVNFMFDRIDEFLESKPRC